jgi:hypothetical protein
MIRLSHIIFVGLLGFTLSFTSDSSINRQTVESEYIYWGQKLKWSDFRGSVPPDSKFDALTHSLIDLKFEGEGKYLTFNIETIFDPNQSWKKEGVNDYVLNHEQLHFDITEYQARLLRKKLKSHKYKDVNSIETEVRKMFNDAYQNATDMQVKYDHDTNHSLNKKKQSKWNKKVRKLLQQTRSYKNPKIKVNIGYLLMRG